MTITRCFLRLSKVRILPKVANHAKKAALKGAWVCHTLFQGKRLLQNRKNDLTLKRPFLEGTHQSLSSLPLLMVATTKVSFDQAIPKRTGKASLRTVSPHHRLCQNLILFPSPTTSLGKLENDSQPFLMFFHNPTPKVPAGSREHHPPHKLPHLESTTILHQGSLSIP
jgi:hypothetical protein